MQTSSQLANEGVRGDQDIGSTLRLRQDSVFGEGSERLGMPAQLATADRAQTGGLAGPNDAASPTVQTRGGVRRGDARHQGLPAREVTGQTREAPGGAGEVFLGGLQMLLRCAEKTRRAIGQPVTDIFKLSGGQKDRG